MASDNDHRDVLIELTDEEIEDFRKFYKELGQLEFVHVHLYLKNQLRWNKEMKKMTKEQLALISDRCKMKFFRFRFGKTEIKTLIGITGENEYSIFVMTLDETLSELKTCLMESKVIKWEKLPLFVAVHRMFHKFMYDIFEAKHVKVRIDNFCSTMHQDKLKAVTYQYSVPEGVEMKPLRAEDYVLMNDLWPYKYPGSDRFIRSLIVLNGGLGIYRNNQLVSWILQVESFGLGLLQTSEDHQGKGFARVLTRALARNIASQLDEDVILFASYSKPKTVDLYFRYGFKHASYTHWFYLAAV